MRSARTAPLTSHVHTARFLCYVRSPPQPLRPPALPVMSQSAQTTVFVSGIGDNSDEATLHAAFQPFGEIVEIHMPKQRGNADGGGGTSSGREPHRGFAFVVFSAAEEAEGALDNMHLNEVDGRILSVTPGKRSETGGAHGGKGDAWKPVWEDEDWIKEYGTGPDANEAHADPSAAATEGS